MYEAGRTRRIRKLDRTRAPRSSFWTGLPKTWVSEPGPKTPGLQGDPVSDPTNALVLPTVKLLGEKNKHTLKNAGI